MTMEASLMKNRPKDHVRPSRHNRAKAPMTHDFIFSSRLESGFRVVECFTILYIVMTRKMRLSMMIKVTGPIKLHMK